MIEVGNVFFVGYCCFIVGVLVGILVKMAWFAQASKGAVKFVISIDGEKLK